MSYAVDSAVVNAMSGWELRAISKDPVALAIFRIDEKIRHKLMDYVASSSIDIDLKLPGREEMTNLQGILARRGFYTIAHQSSFDSLQWSLCVRWLGAGCPD